MERRTPNTMWLPAVALIYLVFYAVTSPLFTGDSAIYAADAAAHLRGTPAPFWEFGHLLWRPWGAFGCWLFGGTFQHWFSDSPAQAAARFLMATSFLCGLLSQLLLFSLFRRFAPHWAALAAAVALNAASPVLNYCHSATPYIPSLAFFTFSLWLLTAPQGTLRSARNRGALAGTSFAVSCALWFPFALAGLGLAAFAAYGFADGAPDRRSTLLAAFLVSLSVSTALLFCIGAANSGVRDAPALRAWIAESGHGWQQTGRAMRAVTGLPRAVWDYGGDTLALKRFLLHDPYNPESLRGFWAARLTAKLALFYLGFATVLWELWAERRVLLIPLAAAGLPLLFFAVAVFEPSSPERFLPLFPLAGMALARALSVRHRFPAALAGLLVAAVTVVNLAETRAIAATAAYARLQALNQAARPGSIAFVVTIDDELYALPALRPLDPVFASARVSIKDLMAVSMAAASSWRADFAARALARWASRQEVWISERALRPTPLQEWKWAEGVDPRLHWQELPEMFAGFSFDSRTSPGGDGFVRLARSASNEARLRALAATNLLPPGTLPPATLSGQR